MSATNAPGTKTWKLASLGIGIGALALAIYLLMASLSLKTKADIAGGLCLGSFVAGRLLIRDPSLQYRRLQMFAIGLWFLLNGAGYTATAVIQSRNDSPAFHWDGAAGWLFNLLAAMTYVILVRKDTGKRTTG